MITRKSGETHKQWAGRLEAYAETLAENNRALRSVVGTDTLNPRTGRTFKAEAQEMFITVALIEEALRRQDYDFCQGMAQGQLDALGLDMVAVYQNEALQEGAYTGIK